MFMVLLKFSENKAQASQFMEAHNAWIKQGFDDGVFLLVGSLFLLPAILAYTGHTYWVFRGKVEDHEAGYE